MGRDGWRFKRFGLESLTICNAYPFANRATLNIESIVDHFPFNPSFDVFHLNRYAEPSCSRLPGLET